MGEGSEALDFGVGRAVEGAAEDDAEVGIGVDLEVADAADFEGVTDGVGGETADGLANLN